MNNKQYINAFEELKGLEACEQERILEQARYEAFVRLGLAGRCAVNLGFCMLLAGLIAATPLFITLPPAIAAYSTVINGVFVGIGVAVCLFVYHRLHRRLLRRGLERVLSKANG